MKKTVFKVYGAETLVVRTRDGWYVSRTRWAGGAMTGGVGVSTHALVVTDVDHALSPRDFAGAGEMEVRE